MVTLQVALSKAIGKEVFFRFSVGMVMLTSLVGIIRFSALTL